MSCESRLIAIERISQQGESALFYIWESLVGHDNSMGRLGPVLRGSILIFQAGPSKGFDGIHQCQYFALAGHKIQLNFAGACVSFEQFKYQASHT